MKPGSPALQMDSLLSEPPGEPLLPICFKNLLPLKLMYCFLRAKSYPCGSAGKESTCNMRDLGLIPGLGRSPGKGNGYPLQCSGLENSMGYTHHGIAKSQTQLSNFHFHQYVLSHFNHVQLFETLWTVARQAPLSMDSPGKNTGECCHVQLEGIFLTQGLNPCFLSLMH